MYRRKLAELDACIARMSAVRDQVAARLAAAERGEILQITARPPDAPGRADPTEER